MEIITSAYEMYILQIPHYKYLSTHTKTDTPSTAVLIKLSAAPNVFPVCARPHCTDMINGVQPDSRVARLKYVHVEQDN
jgi:hypothetical protein